MTTTSKNEQIVEATLPPLPLHEGHLAPWRRGGSLAPGAIGKFRPAPMEVGPLARWIPGQRFLVDVGRDVLTVQVERYMPERFTPATIEKVHVGGRWFSRAYPERVVPELVVVVVLSFEVKRDEAKR